ncbi:MAG TPA: SAM-dependent chlorinase/fluorinase [Cytophagaceae bacterium]
MAIVTFMSDFGHRDPYVAAVKAKIISVAPDVQVIDISHHIEHFNIPHAAYVLRSVFRDFPIGTVHLVSVNAPAMEKELFVALNLEGHYFIGADNGLFSLISDENPTAIVALANDQQDVNIFPEKRILAETAALLAKGEPLENLGKPVDGIRRMMNRQLRITKTQISGHVIHVDNYGNLITNITREAFERVWQGRPYTISFARETLDVISHSYDSRDNGDCLALFNTVGYLEIAISQGNASELLGMDFDSPVNVFFT